MVAWMGKMVIVYLDACCLNRPFDDQTQDRIHLEAEAILLILTRLEAVKWQWLGSEALDFEIGQTPDPQRRNRVKLLAAHAHRVVVIEKLEVERAQQLVALGFQALDALHLACAESGAADVFLTTDDKLLRLAAVLSEQLRVRVANPLAWIREVTEQ